MFIGPVSLLVVAIASLWAMPEQRTDCTAAALSDAQIKALVAKARETQKELPAPPGDFTVSIRRQGCHYIYTESGVPARPDRTNMFWINQHGAIVDVRPGAVACPEKVLSESALAEIVRVERSKRTDLPPPFAKPTVEVGRLRCLYLYSEFGNDPSQYVTFTIDPFGEVMDVFRGK